MQQSVFGRLDWLVTTPDVAKTSPTCFGIKTGALNNPDIVSLKVDLDKTGRNKVGKFLRPGRFTLALTIIIVDVQARF